MILLIDNYDSFAYNLYQVIGSLNPDIRVIRNDAMTIKEIRELDPECIILSPGPGRPADAGVCEDVVKELGAEYPILGVCLGHQAICEASGAVVTYAKKLMHGKSSVVDLDLTSPLFNGMQAKETVGRYHSLAVKEDTLPAFLKVIARADDGEVMAVQHTEYPIFGMQFHPESIMTPHGRTMLKNFIAIEKK
ncbi:MAG: aminodeoxychorismate/anthranilate synthase component II [Eubacterium sp.]|nr:aminodeoxychorismate/anthranilate synthase component II [Eubacterium sp.]